jgi:hypothetical protein
MPNFLGQYGKTVFTSKKAEAEPLGEGDGIRTALRNDVLLFGLSELFRKLELLLAPCS